MVFNVTSMMQDIASLLEIWTSALPDSDLRSRTNLTASVRQSGMLRRTMRFGCALEYSVRMEPTAPWFTSAMGAPCAKRADSCGADAQY
jgi:hypothetical protein